MRFNEFRPDETTPETTSLVWFVVHESQAAKIIKKKFGKVIQECGGALSVPGKYWSLIQNLAYTSGGEVEQVPMPKKCAEKTKIKANGRQITVDARSKRVTFESRRKDEDDLEEESNVLTPQFDLETNKINDAGAGVQQHTQIDNYVQSAFATQKPIKPVPMP
jgi:hypothetical protein